MQIEPGKVKNILAVRNDRFGEFLLNIPAFRALKETFVSARLTVVTDPYVESLAKNIPFIDEIIVRRQKGNTLSSKLALVNLLRRKNFDIAVMLNPSREFNIITYLAGIPIRAGYDRKWGFLLTHKIKDEKYLSRKHEVDYNLELAALIGARTPDKGLSLQIDAGLADSLLLPFDIKDNDFLLALHPWTSDPVKQWPKENFRELAGRLISLQGIRVVIIGGREEAQKDSGLFDGYSKEKIINLAGKTSLSQLAAVLKKCKLLISCDSGPVHLAGCLGIPVIALFRSGIPGKSVKRWGPLGGGNIVMEKDNLFDMTAQELFDKAKEKIEKISHN